MTKYFRFFMSIALMWSLTGIGSCVNASLPFAVPQCEGPGSADHGITAQAPGTCTLVPCRSDQLRFFLLPDSQPRNHRIEKDGFFQWTGPIGASNSVVDPGGSWRDRVVVKFPLPPVRPSLFYLHCSMIC